MLIAKAHDVQIGAVEVLLHTEQEGTSGSVEIRDTLSDPDKLPGFLVTCVAGQVGQSLWLVRYRKQRTFEIAMTHVEAGACHDMWLFQKYGGRNPVIPLGRARDLARTMLTQRWELVERHAVTLVHNRSLDSRTVTTDVTKDGNLIADWSKSKHTPMSAEDTARIDRHKTTGCAATHGRSDGKGMLCGVCGKAI
jgi:hypothetical protein